MSQPQITVYGAHWCPDCRCSKQFLGEHQIPYNWVDIEQDRAGEAYVLLKNHGKRIIPTIEFADGSILVEQRVQVVRVAVDAAWPHQADQVQICPPLDRGLHRLQKGRIGEEFAAGDTFVDARQFLMDDASRPEIQMPHLRVSHQPRRQPHVLPRSRESPLGVVALPLVHIGGVRLANCVAFSLFADTPTIEYNEYYWSPVAHVF